jgi:transcription-repair coupling factor (superfamily II helicase)
VRRLTEQAGHMKKLGTGFYHKLLAAAILNARNQVDKTDHLELDLGFTGYIPSDYVPDAIVRLSLYTRLMRLTDPLAVDDFGDELLDRFGEMPLPVQHLMRIAKLKLVAVRHGLSKLSAGPLALAISFGSRSDPALARQFSSLDGAYPKGNRIVFKRQTASIEERLSFLEEILAEPK